MSESGKKNTDGRKETNEKRKVVIRQEKGLDGKGGRAGESGCVKRKWEERDMTQDKNAYMTLEEESKEEWSADCRGIISVLTLGTSITFSVVTPTGPSPQLTYQSGPRGLIETQPVPLSYMQNTDRQLLTWPSVCSTSRFVPNAAVTSFGSERRDGKDAHGYNLNLFISTVSQLNVAKL